MENVILEKSYRLSVRIVRLNQYIRSNHREYVLSRQLLRAGTSIGANVTEAQHAQSKADFIAKLSIALKETGETKYWLRLLNETDYLPDAGFRSVMRDCIEVERLLIAIIKSAKL